MRSPVIKAGTAILVVLAVLGGGWGVYSYQERAAAADAAPVPAAPPAPQVTVSKPLVRDLEPRIGFLGQFSAVDQVEIRAQVGGILTDIHFQDGAIVKKGDL